MNAVTDEMVEAAEKYVPRYNRKAIRDALTAALSIRQGGVKALEWSQVHGEGVETEQALSILPGSYRVFIDEDSAAGAIFAEWAAEEDHFCMTSAKRLGRFHDWDTAKAAAQADFNTRILSALSPAQEIADKPSAVSVRDVGPVITPAMKSVAADYLNSLGITEGAYDLGHDLIAKVLKAAQEGK